MSAFACAPGKGSEPGMGWNWVVRLARHHDIWLITEQDNVPLIESFFSGCKRMSENISIFGIPHIRNFRLESIWPHFYYMSYRRWQWQAYLKAKALHEDVGFDLAHQLNMIWYREPGYLWKLPVPFVWGPIGGHAQMPWRYLSSLGLGEACHFGLRNILNRVQAVTSYRVAKAMAGASRLIAATTSDQIAIKKYHGHDSILINEQGASQVAEPKKRQESPSAMEPLRIVWCGRFLGGKALPLGLRAIAIASRQIPLEFHIVGYGACESSWKGLAQKLGVQECCIWHGRKSREDALKIVSRSDMLLFTSLQEGTPAVVMEAIQNGIPVVCHDICGHGDMIDTSCGIKIPVSDPRTSVAGFSQAIAKLGVDRRLLSKLKQGALDKAQQESWDRRTESMLQVYEEVLSGPGCDP